MILWNRLRTQLGAFPEFRRFGRRRTRREPVERQVSGGPHCFFRRFTTEHTAGTPTDAFRRPYDPHWFLGALLTMKTRCSPSVKCR